MKTTIELPDDLLIEVKKAAAERRTTIRAMVERGLRHELEAGSAGDRPRPRIRWVTVDGGLPPDLDVSDRTSLRRWMERAPDDRD